MTKLQELRKAKGYSQSELADRAGVKLHVMQHYETGYRSIDGANLATLTALAGALGVKLYDLLADAQLAQDVKRHT